MQRFTSKGIHIVKVGKLPHKNMISKPNNCEKRMVQMQDIGNTFEIEPNESCYDEELIDIMIKGLITNIKDNPSEEKIKYIRTKAKNNYLKYMRHINDNVGRPVLAVNSDIIIESKGEN